eukprot:jgi/Hompol1/4229/HPOL_006994-RA
MPQVYSVLAKIVPAEYTKSRAEIAKGIDSTEDILQLILEEDGEIHEAYLARVRYAQQEQPDAKAMAAVKMDGVSQSTGPGPSSQARPIPRVWGKTEDEVKALMREGKCFECGQAKEHSPGCRRKSRFLMTSTTNNIKTSSNYSPLSPVLLDTGASVAMVRDRTSLKRIWNVAPVDIQTASGKTITATEKGIWSLSIQSDSSVVEIEVPALHVPLLTHDLLPPQILADLGATFDGKASEITVRCKSLEFKAKRCADGLYWLYPIISQQKAMYAKTPADDVMTWHARLGHASARKISQIGDMTGDQVLRKAGPKDIE